MIPIKDDKSTHPMFEGMGAFRPLHENQWNINVKLYREFVENPGDLKGPYRISALRDYFMNLDNSLPLSKRPLSEDEVIEGNFKKTRMIFRGRAVNYSIPNLLYLFEYGVLTHTTPKEGYEHSVAPWHQYPLRKDLRQHLGLDKPSLQIVQELEEKIARLRGEDARLRGEATGLRKEAARLRREATRLRKEAVIR